MGPPAGGVVSGQTQRWWWPQQGHRSHTLGAVARPCWSRDGGRPLSREQLVSEPNSDPAEQGTHGDGARRWRQRSFSCLMASFLAYGFPFFRLQPVMVFKLPLRASASHFRFLEACSELPGVGVRVCGVSSNVFE